MIKTVTSFVTRDGKTFSTASGARVVLRRKVANGSVTITSERSELRDGSSGGEGNSVTIVSVSRQQR
jgi:hypothetical protein